jgi:PhzF family phenazine biosynthesis protein
MTRLPLYQVDAFTNQLFGGNPAALCPLDSWLADDVLQSIAAENNLAETAYFVPEGHGFRLRWFTPAVEVDLCGHATLASAFLLMTKLGWTRPELRFETRSGTLTVVKEGDRFTMDFPSRPPEPVPDLLTAALGAPPIRVLAARDYLAVFETEAHVRALKPDFAAVAKLPRFAVIATAPGNDCDFVSRFFAPAQGIPEDPVTGSAHSTLTPYWAKQLGKSKMFGRQVSQRGGELWVEDRGERVSISGQAVLYLEGSIFI